MKTLAAHETLLSRDEPPSSQPPPSLCESVRRAVESYFDDLGGHPPGNLYELVMGEVERPLLQTVMEQVQGNQTRAAEMLGINRSTLRKKLTHHGLHK